MRLLTIPFSHYNERARWALCHHGVAVRERRVLPGLHLLAVRATTRAEHQLPDATSSPYSTPVLVTDAGEILASSTEIVRWVDQRASSPDRRLIDPAHEDAIDAIERRAHDVLGPATRAIAYYFLSRDPATFTELVDRNVGLGQRLFFRATRRRILGHVSKRFDEAKLEEATETLRGELAWLGDRLGDDAYYVGGRFGAADLTVAALLAPVILPVANYGAFLPPGAGAWTALCEEVRESAAGRHALRMFDAHRSPRPAGWVLA